jgi:hypothetical protein
MVFVFTIVLVFAMVRYKPYGSLEIVAGEIDKALGAEPHPISTRVLDGITVGNAGLAGGLPGVTTEHQGHHNH